jgi:cell division protein FtsB
MTRARRPAGRASTAPKARSGSRSRTTAATAAPTEPAEEVAAPALDRGSATRNRFTGRAAVLLAVLVMLGVAYAWPLREYVRQRGEITDLRASTRDSQAKVDALQAEKDRWADPAYVEAQARARLHYVMPGEVAFVVLHPNQPNLVQTLPKTPPPVESWYDALWATVHGADQPATTQTGAQPGATSARPSAASR